MENKKCITCESLGGGIKKIWYFLWREEEGEGNGQGKEDTEFERWGI